MTRQFVCVRLDSYENEQTIATVRELQDGALVNTSVAVFAPDGRTKLTPKSRSLRGAVGSRSVEDGLRKIARLFPGRNLDEPAHTPDFSSVREAVNVAACDGRPLVLAWAKDESDRKSVEAELRALAWSPEFVGRVHWDLSIGEDFREYVPNGLDGERGVTIVQSEPFGRTAEVIGAIDLDLSLEDQRWVLRRAIEHFESSFEKLSYQEHVQQGNRLGVHWEEAIRMGDRDDGPGSDRSRRRRRRDP